MKQTHPSFGMLGFHRISRGDGRPLFGSSILHRDTISLVLKTGAVDRTLNTDWYSGGNKLFEVEMSGEQFANLLCNMNSGDGVPVTIRYTETLGRVKGDDMPFESKIELHAQEFKNHCSETMGKAHELLKTVEEKFHSKKTFLKSDKEEIEKLLWQLELAIGSNMEYQLDAFNEQIEQSKVEAKAEIEMFWQNKLMQITQQALVEKGDVLLEQKENVVELIMDET